MEQQYVTLRNGVQMPQVGFGVFRVKDYDECYQAVRQALDAGYLHIDTATAYINEEAVGAAIKDSGVPREEIFVTSKLWISQASYEGAKQAYADSCQRLGLDYLDLYLIHQPWSDYHGAWRALIELYNAGKVRAIGVSNFYPERFTDLVLASGFAPMVNQIEMHPFNQNLSRIAFNKQYDCVVEAWSPFAAGYFDIWSNTTLQAIADKHHKTIAQVVIRWLVQLDVVPLPKSANFTRAQQNLQVWDFELDAADLAQIATLDSGTQISNHHSVDQVTVCYNHSKTVNAAYYDKQ